MYRRKLMQFVGVIIVFWSNTSSVLSAGDLVYLASPFPQSVVDDPPGAGDESTAANGSVTAVQTSAVPEVPDRSTLEAAHPVPSPAAESSHDRFIAMGIAAALLVFAFFRKKPPQAGAALKDAESSKFQLPSERAPPVAPATAELAAELAAAELATATKLAATKLAAAKLAAGYDSDATQAIARNIVVPVDLSPNSECAIRLALVWTKPDDRVKVIYACDLENAFPLENLTPSNLTVIHPAFENIDRETADHWSQLPWVVVLPLAMEIVERWAINALARLVETVPVAQRGRVDFHVLYGDPVVQIVKLSEAISAKLIVLVAHQHSSTARLITGSHADRLLHVSRIPVIVVCEPVKAEPGLPQEIVITTDYSVESLPVFHVLKDLMQGIKPGITVLTVETPHEPHPKTSAMLAGLKKEFRSLGFQLSDVTLEASDVEGGILDYVRINQPQLIAMSSHGRLGFSELIHGSVTKRILHDSGVPILVVRGHAIPTTETAGSLFDFFRETAG